MGGMRPITRTLLLLALLVGFAGPARGLPTATASLPAGIPDATASPLQRSHAHNDYEHDRPLYDALDHGFASVEADVWLVDGQLLVAHDLADVSADRTLDSLYLRPLAARAARYGEKVYPHWDGTFQLLIDVKSEATPTYLAVHRALARYPQLMTTYRGGLVQKHAVDAVISGNRDLGLMRSQPVRYAGYDGRVPDLAGDLSASLMPLVSDNWTKYFLWQGVGPMPEVERARLHQIVDTAHAKGYRVRFWATPDTAGDARDAVWRELLAADVDEINTDDLAGLQAFLTANDPAS